MSDQPPPDASSPAPGASGPGDPDPGHAVPASSTPGVPADPAAPPPPAARQPPGWGPTAPAPAWDPAAPPQGWALPPGPYGGQHWYPGAPFAYPAPAGHGWYPPGFDPADALVTPPGAGLGGWFSRCVGAVRRGWRLLLPILLLTQVLPAATLSVLSLLVDPSADWDAAARQNPDALPDTFLTDLATVFGVLIGGSLLVGLVQSVGWAAGTWVIARQAAGEPVGLGAALRYGLRRAPGLWGWTLLLTLIIGLGLCFCVIPGIYFAFVLSMAGPVWLFERRPPIDRSYRMFHARLGLVLGRVALVAAAVIVGTVAAGMVEVVGTLPFGTTPLEAPGSAAGVVLVTLAAAVLALPAHLAQLVGLVATYAEQRAHEGPVNAARLAGELG